MTQDTLHIFVDEAGDPTLFANRRRAIVGTGCQSVWQKAFGEEPQKLEQVQGAR